VAERENTLVLPVRSVRDALSGQPWVLGIKDGRASKKPVQLGLRGNSRVEIIDGMTDGEFAIPASSGVLNGQRVRAIAP
jgi:HlyD family secretion protein